MCEFKHQGVGRDMLNWASAFWIQLKYWWKFSFNLVAPVLCPWWASIGGQNLPWPLSHLSYLGMAHLDNTWVLWAWWIQPEAEVTCLSLIPGQFSCNPWLSEGLCEKKKILIPFEITLNFSTWLCLKALFILFLASHPGSNTVSGTVSRAVSLLPYKGQASRWLDSLEAHRQSRELPRSGPLGVLP